MTITSLGDLGVIFKETHAPSFFKLPCSVGQGLDSCKGECMDRHTKKNHGTRLTESLEQELKTARSSFIDQEIEDVYDEMTEAFVNEKDVLFHQLRMAIKEKNRQLLARTAHRIKGSALSLGLHSMASVVLEIERQSLCPETDWTVVHEMLEQLIAASEHFVLLIGKSSAARRIDARKDETA
jgi:HPt (histidine-containing phosphotransfer) domain-containing protein